MASFSAAGETVSQWGEGPIWWDDSLYYVDIEGHLVIRYSPSTGSEETWKTGERVGTVVPRQSGGLVIAGDSGFRSLDTDSGEISPLADPESDKPDNRFNDGKCDPSGRFWAGTMHLKKPRQAVAALYRMSRDHSVHPVLDGITVSNGLVWSREKDAMFYIDTPTEKIVAFDFDNNSGAISNQRTVADTTGFEGVPDGMAIDENDNLWVAMCHGGQIRCFDSKNGELLEVLDSPTKEVTAPAFGGPDLSHLYVATGQSGITEGDPLAGRMIVTGDVGVKGVPAFAFAG